jgi:hypothetical protein
VPLPAAVTPVDDHRFFHAETLGGARSVHRRVAAAVDGDAAAEFRGFALLGAGEKTDRVEYLAGFPAGDVDLLADVCAHRDEYGVEPTFLFFHEHVFDAMIERDLHSALSSLRGMR